MEDMEIPAFLQNNDEDDLHEELLAMIPDEYDKSEGQHYYYMSRPPARVLSQFRGYDAPEAIKLIWPRFSYGEYLDYHGELRNIIRKSALYANGKITITGTPGTVIPAGYTVSTEAKNDINSHDYATTELCTIGEDGTVEVQAVALTEGAEGNTAANTIVVNTSSFDDVTSVINKAAFTGGVDEESDEAYYLRIREYDQTQGDSNIGNPSDYKRWAESVPGTGTAKVIRATDNSGVITIILTDGNGEPATESLCESVYNYIMSPDNEDTRIAPCGANLIVTPPTTAPITITANIRLTAGSVQSTAEAFATALKLYFSEAIENKEILYQRVCNVLGDVPGVYDFSDLTVNGKTANIPLADGVFPSVTASDITLTLT